MKSSWNWMAISHRLLPSVGSLPTAMKPPWPSMLMSSTLARASSSVLRSRPIGLPRYQVNEKCVPTMPPPTSHWQPTELRAVLTRPVTRVSWLTVWSLMPPHSGKNGPCVALAGEGAAEDCGLLLGPDELLEQAANAGRRRGGAARDSR